MNDPKLKCGYRDELYAATYPCVGCGYCCKEVLCLAGAQKHGFREGPCPEVREEDGRYWCGLVSDAEGEEKLKLIEMLSIGAGCSSAMNSDRCAVLGMTTLDIFEKLLGSTVRTDPAEGSAG
jgi:hypothetical protein